MDRLVEEIARIIEPAAFAVWDESWERAPRTVTHEALMTVSARDAARAKARAILDSLGGDDKRNVPPAD